MGLKSRRDSDVFDGFTEIVCHVAKLVVGVPVRPMGHVAGGASDVPEIETQRPRFHGFVGVGRQGFKTPVVFLLFGHPRHTPREFSTGTLGAVIQGYVGTVVDHLPCGILHLWSVHLASDLPRLGPCVCVFPVDVALNHGKALAWKSDQPLDEVLGG